MPGTLKNYYEMLGVPRSANADQIRTAYRKLLLKFHPDKNIGDVYFEDWSKKINEAFEVLISPDLRSEYDQVYEETKQAWSQAAKTTNQESDSNAEKEEKEEAISIDSQIQKLVPVYISAKQSHMKAIQSVSEIEGRLAAKKTNIKVNIIVSSGVILGMIIWAALSNKNIFSQWNQSVTAPAEASAVKSSLPLLTESEPLVKSTANTETVDLWFKVNVSKAWFLEEPGGQPTTRFLSRGNKLHASKRLGNYYYGVFQSSVNQSYKIEGWINGAGLELLSQQTGASH